MRRAAGAVVAALELPPLGPVPLEAGSGRRRIWRHRPSCAALGWWVGIGLGFPKVWPFFPYDR
eukprot:2640292-Prymnesium_polylepis.1